MRPTTSFASVFFHGGHWTHYTELNQALVDGESVEHHKLYVGKRIKWGLFKTKYGQLINADVNGTYNIITKAALNAVSADRIEAVGLVPQSIKI